jgi:hypothetical protein
MSQIRSKQTINKFIVGPDTSVTPTLTNIQPAGYIELTYLHKHFLDLFVYASIKQSNHY